MDINREFQKVKSELEQKQQVQANQIRSEFARFSGDTRKILNLIDEKIEIRVTEMVRDAFAEIKTLISKIPMRTV